MADQVVLVLAEVAHCFPDILNISLLSVNDVISTALKVVRALVESIRSWVVLSTYQDFGRDT